MGGGIARILHHHHSKISSCHLEQTFYDLTFTLISAMQAIGQSGIAGGD